MRMKMRQHDLSTSGPGVVELDAKLLGVTPASHASTELSPQSDGFQFPWKPTEDGANN